MLRTAAALTLAPLLAATLFMSTVLAETAVVEHVTTGPAGATANAAANFDFASDDGRHVFFETTEKLLPSDADSGVDVYVRRIVPPSVLAPPGVVAVPPPGTEPPTGPTPPAAACAVVTTGTKRADRVTGTAPATTRSTRATSGARRSSAARAPIA